MSSTTSSGNRKRPSDRTIAFAVSIVLSKPEELTVREYIQLLRQHIAKGRRENAISSAYRHLDRSSYWRSEYERLKDTLKAAEGENIDLKREIDGLKSRSETARPGSPNKKRKKADEDVVSVPRSPKKSKQDSSPTKSSDEHMVDFDFADVGEVGNILMRTLYQVQALLRSTNKPDPPVLAYHLERAASALPQVIQRTLDRDDDGSNSDAELLRPILSAASRTLMVLMAGFNRLSHVADGAEVQGHVIYAFVQMYGKLVESFENISISEIRKSSTIGCGSERKQLTSKTKTKQPKLANPRGNTTLNTMSSFLCGIVDNLDAKTTAHKALYEGFAYVVLNELGERLYVLVFGHRRGATIEDEITFSTQPDEIEDDAEIAANNPAYLQLKAAKLEAPYLIHLLNRIMSVAPAHLGAITNNKTVKSKQANSKCSTKGALAIHAKDRLQRTLVNCMFGSESTDEYDPFMDCLRMPVANGPVPLMPKIKEVDVQEWFKEEVWRLLGWDILSKEGGL